MTHRVRCRSTGKYVGGRVVGLGDMVTQGACSSTGAECLLAWRRGVVAGRRRTVRPVGRRRREVESTLPRVSDKCDRRDALARAYSTRAPPALAHTRGHTDTQTQIHSHTHHTHTRTHTHTHTHGRNVRSNGARLRRLPSPRCTTSAPLHAPQPTLQLSQRLPDHSLHMTHGAQIYF